MMVNVDYLVLAVRNIYNKNKDYEKILTWLDTLYLTERIKLDLKGILLIGLLIFLFIVLFLSSGKLLLERRMMDKLTTQDKVEIIEERFPDAEFYKGYDDCIIEFYINPE